MSEDGGTETYYYSLVVPGQHSAAAAPVLTSITPNHGGNGGGVPFSLVGTGFQVGAGVVFGGTVPTSVVRVSATLITGVTPATASGNQSVYVVNPDGLASNAVTYNAVAGAVSGAASIVVGQTGHLVQVASFDPTTLALSSYQRGYAGCPWAGTASAGISGNFHEDTPGSVPPVSTTLLNGIAGAQYRRSVVWTWSLNAANATQQMETFVNNGAYTFSVLADVQGPGLITSPIYTNSSFFAADAHWVWGITSTAQVTTSPTLVVNGALQTITRSSGDFTTDGFAIGQTVYIRETASNNGFVSAPISNVSATVLTFAGGGLVTEILPAVACVTSGPYTFFVMNFTGAFPFVSFAITPGVHWIYVRRLSTTQIQVDIDGVSGTPVALAQHTGTSGINAVTDNSTNVTNRADFILYERLTALVAQSDAERDNYKNYLNATYATSF